MTALLDAHDLSVRFGGLLALDKFSLQVKPGEIHGIIGPNGAGKTTAINALTGFLPRLGGKVSFAGKPLPASPHRVAVAGLSRTFQSPTIFPALTAIENIMTGGHRWTRSGLLSSTLKLSLANTEEKALRTAAATWLDRVGYRARHDAPVGLLAFGDLRKLEIARALMLRPRLVVLDEPTAGLTAVEVDHIGSLLRSIRTQDGTPLSVVLIEHNVPFVFSLCDTVSALDKGRLIASGTPAQVRATPAVIESYLGTATTAISAPTQPRALEQKPNDVILSVQGLSTGYGRMVVVHDIDLKVRQGELVLLYGRNGAGKSTLLNALVGNPRVAAGEVHWLGRRIDRLSVSQIVRSGIGLAPQERGVIAGQSIDANLRLSMIGQRIGRAEIVQRIEDILERFPKLRERRRQIAGTLSGGERQMLALAKVLVRQPRLIILDEPTIGLAPIIVEELRRTVARISAEGISLIVAEQNIGWIAPMAHRAYLLDTGRIIRSGAPRDIIREDEVAESYLGKHIVAEAVSPAAMAPSERLA